MLAKHVDSEVYWRNACEKRWGVVKKPAEQVSWKSYFMSIYLQHYIENLEVVTSDQDIELTSSDFSDILRTISPCLFRLRIDSVKTDFDMNEYLGLLTKLKHLRVTYVKKDAKTDFTAHGAGMRTAELRSVSLLLYSLRELVPSTDKKSLELVCNKIDDDGTKEFDKSVQNHPALEELNFSHNSISNIG